MATDPLCVILLATGALLLSLACAGMSVSLSFYRAYFRQKQINAGKDPDNSLKEEFGVWWKVFR